MTFAILRISGKIPVSKDRLTNSDNQMEKKILNFFRRKTGIPNGPEDFLMLSSSLSYSTSSGPAGVR